MVVGQEVENGNQSKPFDFSVQRRFFKEPLEQMLQGQDAKTVCYSLVQLLASPKRKFIKSARSPLRNAMNKFLGGYHAHPGLQIVVKENPENAYLLPGYSPAGDEPGKIIIPDNFPTLLAVNPEQQMHVLIGSIVSLVDPKIENEFLNNRVAEFDRAVSYITKAWDIAETHRVTGALANKLEIWTGKIK